MNIDSIHATNSPQRAATTEASTPPVRQERLVHTAPNHQTDLRAQASQKNDSEQNQLSVQEAVKHLENFVSIARADISFSIDVSSGAQVVKITDSQSKEVIRQFPSEEAIRIAQALDQLQGVFVRDKV